MKFPRLQLTLLLCGIVPLAAWPAAATAQTQDQQVSLGDAARRARAQKKNAPRAARVWTNDSLASLSGTAVSVVGVLTPPPEPAKAESPAAESAAGGEEELKKAEAELAEAKKELERAEKQLDLLQRDLRLQRQQYYSNPNYTSDNEGKAKLDALGAQIGAKQGEVQRAKEKVAALEKKVEDLKRSASPKKPESPPAEK